MFFQLDCGRVGARSWGQTFTCWWTEYLAPWLTLCCLQACLYLITFKVYIINWNSLPIIKHFIGVHDYFHQRAHFQSTNQLQNQLVSIHLATISFSLRRLTLASRGFGQDWSHGWDYLQVVGYLHQCLQQRNRKGQHGLEFWGKGERDGGT